MFERLIYKLIRVELVVVAIVTISTVLLMARDSLIAYHKHKHQEFRTSRNTVFADFASSERYQNHNELRIIQKKKIKRY